MKQRKLYATSIASAFLLTLASLPLAAQQLDTIRAGRFDYGKMWTFENAPAQYFSQTYGFDANAQWFEKARLAALRIPGCSASFVSPQGLVVTNHHCARGYVVQVSKSGENLLDNGFFARTLQEERSISNMYVDQLIAVEDVTAEILAVIDQGTSEQERATLRTRAMTEARNRITQRNASAAGLQVQIVPLYNGGRYSAYTFKRYTNVKLVAAVELQAGFFGGDADNFTYPRYALDFAFLRVYGDDGQPLSTPTYFNWSTAGVQENDAIFVIGNPGPTNRLNTIAQLEYQRDVLLPANIRAFKERLDALWSFYRENPAEADRMDIRNQAFGLSNSLKAFIGRLDALNNPVIMAKKRDAERQLREAINAKPELRSKYESTIDRMASLQQQRRELRTDIGSFGLFGSAYESKLLIRALSAANYLNAVKAGAPADTLAALRTRMIGIADYPPSLERSLLQARLADLQAYQPAGSTILTAALAGGTVDAAVDRILTRSALSTSAKFAAALNGNTLTADDPAIALANAIMPAFMAYQQNASRVGLTEQDLGVQLGRARFDIYGTNVPPDASSSPRITDGVVKGFEYNGTLAPAFTTFYGVYDRHYSFPANPDWALPKRWLPAPTGLDLATPLNFASTADTYGGNSGSPAVTKNLEIVGLNFDRNIQGLSRDFIYLPESGRNVMVDVRAIREALDDVYDLDRIVQELLTHRLYRTEAEADAVRR